MLRQLFPQRMVPFMFALLIVEHLTRKLIFWVDLRLGSLLADAQEAKILMGKS